MRIIGTIPHKAYKISVFSWAEKYTVKIEAGPLEQSFRFPQGAYERWEELIPLFDEVMMEEVRQTFFKMSAGLQAAIARQASNQS
ncbi:MAG TPA: hypothetical protein DHW15_03025 [Bacteroidetes bacterium]|jgi:hypothetical protein|nr:MAG: hypothetical protein ABR94_03220 [Sphingobacteriales bacterium BACL12 MAG-120802-bin5]KRP10404.1 MAG: hypothetical protein ABR95_07420 [Sphingobacteriales bacterium BACL12 MAG-120813-bin55]HCK21152.1 hypothetical protein [Bacteroidota bacterium]